MPEIQSVEVNRIVSPGNVRETDNVNLNDLAASMQETGKLLVPIHVYPGDGVFFVKFGHRRVAAAKLLGWSHVDAIVEEPPADEVTLLSAQYTENEHREGMSYLDRARVYARLKSLGVSQQAIAQRFAVSESAVSLAVSTLRAAPALQQAVNDGRLTPSALEPLLSQPLETQEALADAAIHAKTVRKITTLLQAHKNRESTVGAKRPPVSVSDEVDPMNEMLEQEIRDAILRLKMVLQAAENHPETQRHLRPSVNELVKLANHIKKQVDDV